MATMAIRATATPPTRMDGLSILEATHRFSSTTIPGRTLTMAEGITRRLAVAIRAALAGADTWEASAVVTAAVATAADIAERRCETALIRITSTSYRARRKTLETLKAMTILRFATILTALIGSVSLSIAPLAFPQSDEDSTPSVWESDSIPPPPVADYLKLPPASATDIYSGTSGTTDPDWEEVPETILGPPPVADYLKGPPTLATDGFSGTAE